MTSAETINDAVSSEVCDLLNNYYFEEGKKVGRKEVISELASYKVLETAAIAGENYLSQVKAKFPNLVIREVRIGSNPHSGESSVFLLLGETSELSQVRDFSRDFEDHFLEEQQKFVAVWVSDIPQYDSSSLNNDFPFKRAVV